MITAIGTYLPVWRAGGGRVEGADEDAVTLAVAAALPVVRPDVVRVVLVTRDFPLLEGGNSAALVAGLGLPASTEVVERVGGATATLDALLGARPGTVVIGVDVGPGGAGAAAAYCGGEGLGLALAARANRSLPVVSRDMAGNRSDYSDPRLARERGAAVSVRGWGGKPAGVAGVDVSQARGLGAGDPPVLPTVGASSVLFLLAARVFAPGDVVLAVDQATVVGAVLDGGGVDVVRDERVPRERPAGSFTAGPAIPISLPAYDRAFEAKLRWQASRNRETGEWDFPPRPHDAVRDEHGEVVLTDLPRRGVVYTVTTINVPVPGKTTPYQLVIVELEGGVRALVATTGASAGEVGIGDRGEVVLRRVEVRSGVPDYGYAFRPEAGAA